MVKPENFQISFSNEKSVFYAGQIIEGQVKFRFLRPERAKSLTIFFVGTEATFNGPAGTKRSAEETEIFKVKSVLWNAPAGYFEARSYIFPFKVDLGAYNFPSSYEGEYANIRYKFKAVIDRPSRFGHSTSIPITLLSAIPNFVPELIVPESYSVEGTYGMVSRETLKLLVETKFRSCCPGGKLVLDVSLLPHGTKSFMGLNVKLIQEVKVNGQEKTSITLNTISSLDVPLRVDGGFEDEDDQDFIRLAVPSTTPPTISSSPRITIDYHLLVMATVSWSYAPLTVKIPVQISTLNVTMDEIPPLASGHHYLPPLIIAGQFLIQDEGEVASSLPLGPRHSLTPSLTSDVSSLYSQDSDEFDSRRRSIFQPNYSPGRCESTPFNSKPFIPIEPLSSPRTILS
ncbi:hypothetical protein DSO57_1017142 [Entomophthora muscae]|uniref:Uncharacterized protein n=1 Tax=Entomophthora muscae TaxID=34485 RepID=A0ACC2RJC4_9FUNG|nr:hypothetical protein DSO57_1017142 [Entomophthora muscae]